MIKVAGLNEFNQLCTESNNNGIYKTLVVSPPIDLNIKISSLLSFSVYYEHAVWVTTDGKGHAIGLNRDLRICGTIPKDVLRKEIQFEIQDNEGRPRQLLSAVCGLYYTLYMVQSIIPDGYPELAYVFHSINSGIPLFLNISGRNPTSLYGGDSTSAVIDSDGSVIIITPSIFETPTAECQIIDLPDGLKAVSVAFCEKTIIALSKCGRVFESTFSKNKNCYSTFSEISELRKIEFVQISGTFEHCFAVCSDGSVYGRGSNSYGKLGFDFKIDNVEKFSKIYNLKNFMIKSAFAGSGHSLFQTIEGKVLACGKNNNGQLLLQSGPTKEDVYFPVEVTPLKSPSSFCIAGSSLSVVFLGSEEVPPNNPNTSCNEKRVTQINVLAKPLRKSKSVRSKSSPSEIDFLKRQNEELLTKNEALEKKIRSLTKKLTESNDNANFYKQKVKSIEKELEVERSKNKNKEKIEL